MALCQRADDVVRLEPGDPAPGDLDRVEYGFDERYLHHELGGGAVPSVGTDPMRLVGG